MKLTPYLEYVVNDLLAELDTVSARRMFGGYGLYLDGAIFAFSGADEGLMFKADDTTKEEFEVLGGEQFIYDGHKNKKPVVMPYWTVPESVLEDRQKIVEWAIRSAELSRKPTK